MIGSGGRRLTCLYILEILKEETDEKHPLQINDIIYRLFNRYHLSIDRRSVSDYLHLLEDAEIGVVAPSQGNPGAYMSERTFLDSELRVMIDAVLSSKYIPTNYAYDLTKRIAGLSSMHFRSNVQYIHDVDGWSKTDNKSIFMNIDLVTSAIQKERQVKFDFYKYNHSKEMVKTSEWTWSPYQMVLKNQKYYLMGYCSSLKKMLYFRLDHIKNIEILSEPRVPINEVPGFERGINYKMISSALPYMFSDQPEKVTMIVNEKIIDQVIDWFGKDVVIGKPIAGFVEITIKSSLDAMAYWALQYIDYVEIKTPQKLREKIKSMLDNGMKKYQ